jgi:hypothetical protein
MTAIEHKYYVPTVLHTKICKIIGLLTIIFPLLISLMINLFTLIPWSRRSVRDFYQNLLFHLFMVHVQYISYLKLYAYLTLSNPIFLPSAYSPALIYFGWERGWWVTCNYPTVLKEKIRKSTTCAICWIKSVLHEKMRREQENHNVGLRPTYDFPVPDAFSHVVKTLSNR